MPASPEGRNVVSVPQIAAMLADRIESLARELLPAGKRVAANWHCGSVAGEPGQSLAVRLTGPKAGAWADFAYAQGTPGQSGDALDLVAAVRFGGNKSDAIRWARAYLGLDAMDPASFRRVQARLPDDSARAARAERDEEGKRLSAVKLWLDAAAIAGTPGAGYLESRGLPMAAFRPVPRALRWTERCWCAERRGEHPAIVAAVTRDGKHVATHRTYLSPARAHWVKAAVAKPKKVLGSFAGGFIPLWRGASGKPIAEAPESDVLAITEGIEDGLTMALHAPDWRVVAAVSLSNMAGLHLPPAIREVVLVFDRDGENPAARQARASAVKAHVEAGRRVREFRPPEGFKDMNAWHQAEGLDVLEGEAA